MSELWCAARCTKKRNMPCTVQESELRGHGHGKAGVCWHPRTGESSWAAQSDIWQEARKTAGGVESVGQAPLLHLHFMTATALAGGTGAGSPIWQGQGWVLARWWCLPQGLHYCRATPPHVILTLWASWRSAPHLSRTFTERPRETRNRGNITHMHTHTQSYADIPNTHIQFGSTC